MDIHLTISWWYRSYKRGPTSATFGFDGSKFWSTIHHSPFLLRKLKFSISNTLHNRRKLRRLVHFVVPVQNHLEKVTGEVGAFHILENPLRFFKSYLSLAQSLSVRFQLQLSSFLQDLCRCTLGRFYGYAGPGPQIWKLCFVPNSSFLTVKGIVHNFFIFCQI